MLKTTRRRRNWSTINLSLAVLAVVGCVAGALLGTFVGLGRHWQNRRTFLRNYQTPTDAEAFLSIPAQYALTSTEHNEILFIGSSMCAQGIQTRRFEKRTGTRAYNLGMFGLVGIEGYLAVLQRYLEHHPSPRVIVLCVLPEETGRNLDDYPKGWRDLGTN